MHIMVVVSRQSQLPKMVFALGSSSCFAGGLNRRQEQCHQNANDGDDHE